MLKVFPRLVLIAMQNLIVVSHTVHACMKEVPTMLGTFRPTPLG